MEKACPGGRRQPKGQGHGDDAIGSSSTELLLYPPAGRCGLYLLGVSRLAAWLRLLGRFCLHGQSRLHVC